METLFFNQQQNVAENLILWEKIKGALIGLCYLYWKIGKKTRVGGGGEAGGGRSAGSNCRAPRKLAGENCLVHPSLGGEGPVLQHCCSPTPTGVGPSVCFQCCECKKPWDGSVLRANCWPRKMDKCTFDSRSSNYSCVEEGKVELHQWIQVFVTFILMKNSLVEVKTS